MNGRPGGLPYGGAVMLGLLRWRRLPHWDVPDASYFVTACLAGSIPAAGLGKLRDLRDSLDQQARPDSMSEAAWERRKEELLFESLDALLDGQPTVRHLQQPMLAATVRQAIYHFAGKRYHLLAYVIMPSHMHWVFQPLRNGAVGRASRLPPPSRARRERSLCTA